MEGMKASVFLAGMIIAVAVFFGDVSAYSYGAHGTEYVFGFDGAYARDYRYVDSYYAPKYKVYRYGDYDDFDEERFCEYWDRGELEWKRDRVCEWVNKGDFKERVQRTRAAIWQGESYDARYNIHFGESSGDAGDAFYYNYGDKSKTKPSDWRYKTAFDPRVDNEYVKGYNYYYYEPRYDFKTGTFNWRF